MKFIKQFICGLKGHGFIYNDYFYHIEEINPQHGYIFQTLHCELCEKEVGHGILEIYAHDDESWCEESLRKRVDHLKLVGR